MKKELAELRVQSQRRPPGGGWREQYSFYATVGDGGKVSGRSVQMARAEQIRGCCGDPRYASEGARREFDPKGVFVVGEEVG